MHSILYNLIWLECLHLKYVVEGQILNLGTFKLMRNPYGNVDVGFTQGGQFFGFGGDQFLGFEIGQGKFGIKSDGGVLVGGKRYALDSLFGFEEGRGIGLENQLQLGNQPSYGYQALKHFNAYDNIGPQQTIISPISNDRPNHFFTDHPTLIPPKELDKAEDFAQLPPSKGAGWDEDFEENGRNNEDESDSSKNEQLGDFDDIINQYSDVNDGIQKKNFVKSYIGKKRLQYQSKQKNLPALEGLEPFANYKRRAKQDDRRYYSHA